MKNNFMHEQLPIDDHQPIIARHYDYNRFTYPWHFHCEYEIIYVREGHGERFVADNIGTFGAGDIIFLGSNLPHYMRSSVEYFSENSRKRVTGVVIQFQEDFMAHAIDNYIDLKPIKDLLTKSKRGLLFTSHSNKKIVEQIELLPSYNGIDRFVNLLLLLDRMARSNNKRLLGSRQFDNSLSLFTDDRLVKVLSYVNYHYTEKINLEEVAAKIPMNVTAFCRYFKEKSGRTFMDYILDLRIGYACKLLSGRPMDITQISIASGFNSVSHFNRIFKRKINMTPTEYKTRFSQPYQIL
ncbi:AraC family transcriptional regulator [Massilibacteroides vaginae]|uniref:AraC family transcriptional regulator n=1 Tax=Massilibacteroides vaginae TaxID=1673718 RepID=UPI000A1CEAC7|nr:AraC family transcriptional regulator [Massilibacteroides vaginae]